MSKRAAPVHTEPIFHAFNKSATIQQCVCYRTFSILYF